MRKFKVTTNWLVHFDNNIIITFDGNEHYRVVGDQTDRKLHKDIVEAVPRWFKEIFEDEDAKTN
jgi:hypothetical protein